MVDRVSKIDTKVSFKAFSEANMLLYYQKGVQQ
jgi:hypothetical protein